MHLLIKFSSYSAYGTESKQLQNLNESFQIQKNLVPKKFALNGKISISKLKYENNSKTLTCDLSISLTIVQIFNT